MYLLWFLYETFRILYFLKIIINHMDDGWYIILYFNLLMNCNNALFYIIDIILMISSPVIARRLYNWNLYLSGVLMK